MESLIVFVFVAVAIAFLAAIIAWPVSAKASVFQVPVVPPEITGGSKNLGLLTGPHGARTSYTFKLTNGTGYNNIDNVYLSQFTPPQTEAPTVTLRNGPSDATFSINASNATVDSNSNGFTEATLYTITFATPVTSFRIELND